MTLQTQAVKQKSVLQRGVRCLTDFKAASSCYTGTETEKKILSVLRVSVPAWQVFYLLKDIEKWQLIKNNSLMPTVKHVYGTNPPIPSIFNLKVLSIIVRVFICLSILLKIYRLILHHRPIITGLSALFVHMRAGQHRSELQRCYQRTIPKCPP